VGFIGFGSGGVDARPFLSFEIEMDINFEERY
jgi:hypothetical protein